MIKGEMQMLDPTAITPLYVQLMNMIEEDVSAGRYHTGDRLMTEKEMAETYHISINTVRRAIDKLIEKGLVERKQGKGTFVTKPKFERNMKKLQSFTELCHQIGVKPGGKMLENKVVTADEKTARRLDIPVGSRVVFLSRVRYADQEPVVIEGNYFRWSIPSCSTMILTTIRCLISSKKRRASALPARKNASSFAAPLPMRESCAGKKG